MSKIRVGILCGGKSTEHEISLLSAQNVIDAIDAEKYEVVLLGIDKKGKWHVYDPSRFLLHAGDPQQVKLQDADEVFLLLPEGKGQLMSVKNLHRTRTVDVIFPILHGQFGEDGTVQGMMRLADVPFVGCDVLGSAIGLDKDVMKRLLEQAGIPVAPYRVVRSFETLPRFDEIQKQFGVPFFVKSANSGSSIGVSKVKDADEFQQALDEAFRYDTKVLIEKAIVGREIECAVLGNSEPRASQPGEIIPHDDFYSFKAKYVDENGATIQIPAKISKEESGKIREYAIRVFRVLECSGLSRVDFFLTPSGEIYVNEINTMPGFTKKSMFPKLWEAEGISYAQLIDILIQLAIERHSQQKKLKYSF